MKNEAKQIKFFKLMSFWRWCEFTVLFVACSFFTLFFVFGSNAKADWDKKNNFNAETVGEFIKSSVGEEGTQGVQTEDFSKFRHSNPMHARMPCLLCHKRENNSPVPKLSGHSPCSGCHAQQFAEGNQSPICTICHTATGIKNFPPLQDFSARFDHASHVRQTNCATCHKLTQNGAGFSILQRSNSHQTCFQCHTSTASNQMASCGTCHEPGRPPRAISANAPAYAATPFRHAAHLRSMNCESCHAIRAGMERGAQVSAPVAEMHFAPARAQSCASCHNNKRAFGGEDFNDCRRCHQGRKFKPFV